MDVFVGCAGGGDVGLRCGLWGGRFGLAASGGLWFAACCVRGRAGGIIPTTRAVGVAGQQNVKLRVVECHRR